MNFQRIHFLSILLASTFFGLLAVAGCQKKEAPALAANLPEEASTEIRETFQREGVSGKFSVAVTIDEISELSGTVTAGLYNSEESYNNGGSTRGERIKATNHSISFEFLDLPLGEYAIRVMHDINNNQELDTNSYGIPKEPFAFSNNAKGVMGPASWEDAKFTIDGSDVRQTISFPK